jgi:hypothetical protein
MHEEVLAGLGGDKAATARYRTQVTEMPLRGRWPRWSPRFLRSSCFWCAFPGPQYLEGGVAVVATRFCGYRWITVQVRVRVMPSTAWMREATNRPS